MIQKTLVTIIIGAALFWVINNFTNPIWSRETSIDIFLGAVVEFFALNLLLHFYNQQQDKKTMKHLENHLQKIELLIKKASAKEKE